VPEIVTARRDGAMDRGPGLRWGIIGADVIKVEPPV